MTIEHQSDAASVAPPTTTSVLVSGDETAGHLAVIELCLASGDTSPCQVSTHEDQIIYVLEGQLTIVVDEAVLEASAGTCLPLLRGSDFSYQVRSDVARLLLVTAPAGIEGYYRELGTTDATDVARLVATAARYGISITGPGPVTTPEKRLVAGLGDRGQRAAGAEHHRGRRS